MPYTKLSNKNNDSGPGLGATVLGILVGGVALIGMTVGELITILAEEDEPSTSPEDD